MKKIGKVFLLGAGCGDYDLITLRGMNILKTCDTVVFDSLIDLRVLDLVPKAAERICVGKRRGKHSESQENINQMLVKKAQEGKTVVRLKGGDSFVFGRGGEEILVLQQNNIPYSIVPGISSSIAVPELAGIPVTHRKISRSFHVITGHTADDILPENLSSYASLKGTLVFLMGLKNLSLIADGLIKGGMDENTPAAVISNGGRINQRLVRSDLKHISSDTEKENLQAPAVIVVGETAEFDFSPTYTPPLSGVSVTITGTKKLTDKLFSGLAELGAQTHRIGCLTVKEYEENQALDKALKNIQNYSWLVLTSMNGAEIFLKRLRKLKIDLRELSHIKFAVIGRGTAEILEKCGIFPELVPKVFTSKELGKNLCKRAEKSDKILILRAELGSKELTDALEAKSISFDDIKTYNVCSDRLNNGEVLVSTDYITFASASGVHSFFEDGYKISPDTKIVCIGDITAKALSQHKISCCKVVETAGVSEIIRSILEAEQ